MPLGVSVTLQIEDQDLVEFDLSSWTHLTLIFNQFMLCPWAMSFFFFFSKVVPCPFPSYFMLFLGPQCCLYNLLEGQPENNWPLGEKYCIISNLSRYSGLHLPCFLQHVQQQHLSVNPLGWVTGTQCLLEVYLLVASLQGQLGIQG